MWVVTKLCRVLILGLTFSLIAGCVRGQDGADENDPVIKYFSQKAREAEPLIKALEKKAQGSRDPVLVWHEAAKIDNPYVKGKAIDKMNALLDPRSLPVLDALAGQSCPPADPRRGMYHYPTFAKTAAERLRKKIALDDQLSKASPEERIEVAASILKLNNDDPREEFALAWLLKQPASEGVIDALLLRAQRPDVWDYFVAMDKKFLPILYERLEKTEDGDVAHGLARAFAKRRDSGSAPVLFGILGKEYKKGDKSAPATAAMTLGSFGAQVLPDVVKAWKEHRDFPTRKRLVIVCKVVGTAASRTLLEQWREENKADLIEMKNSGKTESEDYKSKCELAAELRISLERFKEKEVAP